MTVCVVFDFDGTLVQSAEIKRRAFFDIVADEPGAAQIIANILEDPQRGDRHAILARCARELGFPPSRARAWAAAYEDQCAREIAACPEVPGAGQTMQALRLTNALLFVNSATPRAALLPLIQARGLEPYFDGVFGAPMRKDEALRQIMADVGATPGRTVMVGDEPGDAQAAAAVGCRFFAVAPTSQDDGRWPRADIVRPDLTDAADLICALLSSPRANQRSACPPSRS